MSTAARRTPVIVLIIGMLASWFWWASRPKPVEAVVAPANRSAAVYP